MMKNALNANAGIVPAEQFAKSGSQANHRVLTSGLFCDITRALNRVAAIESVDLQNCFDQVAHPVVSIALQSFKVNKTVVAMTLMVLQITAWHLRTSFGESNRSFGGSKDEPSMGLAPLMVETIFNVISTLTKTGMTILLVEQNARLALQLAQRAYVMESGLITLAGSGTELMADARVRKAYLGE